MDFICEKDDVYSEEAMEEFRAFSGDSNSLHCDLMYAKQNNFPQKVVYGCLILTKLVSVIGDSKIKTFRADFINPVFVNECVKVRFSHTSKMNIRIEIVNGNQLKMKMNLELVDELQSWDFLFENLASLTFSGLNKSELIILLGMLSESVGMVEPGDLALIRSINFTRKTNRQRSKENVKLKRSSDRFGIFQTILTTRTLVLEALSLKRNFESAAQILEGIRNNFGEMQSSQPPERILIYGITGTMGLHLGLMCAYLGHEIFGVYRSAEARASELNDLAIASNLKIKLMNESESRMPTNKSVLELATVVLYCSSPPIHPNFGTFNQTLYESYKSIYVDGLAEVIETVPKVKNFFIPSTVILDEDSAYKYGNLEYSLAKAEQEDLISRRSAELNVLMPRVDFFPGRHTQISFSAGKDVLTEIQVTVKDWLGGLR
jgi:acyl dehydratase